MEMQKAPNGQDSLEKSQVGALTLPEIKTSFKVTVSKALWYWFRDR